MPLLKSSSTANDQTPDIHVEGEIPVPTLIIWLTISAVCALSFFAYRGYLQDRMLTLYVLTGFATLLTVNAVVYSVAGRESLLRGGFIVLITLLFSYLAVFAIEDGTSILWLFAYPPVVFYISDQRMGLLTCLGGWIALALLFSPFGSLIVETPYSANFRLLMLSTLGFEMVSCFALDQSRRRSKQSLLQLATRFEFAAKHDALTGLFNRREGHSRLEGEYERYLRNNRSFSVLLMDIDLFKKVNDNYGHQAGDAMIKLVANTLCNECRKVDTPARWGGEEFLVILPETDTLEATQIANRIRQSFAGQSIEFDGRTVSATISIGVATIQGSESSDRVLQRADEALYRAKTLGRNKVCDYSSKHSAA